MQPLSGGDNKSVLLSSKGGSAGVNVNTEAFWRKKVEDVAADEIFFHRYFSQIGKGKQTSKKVAKPKTVVGSDDEDENEDEIWQALVDSRPEVEGGSEGDSDMEMLDLEDSEEESDAESGGVDVESDGEAGDEGVIFNDSEGSVSAMDDEEALIGSDEDAPSEIDELFEKELEKGGQGEGEKPKKETARDRKKKMKNLPTFASAEDYAEMLDNDEDEDAGL